MKKQEIPVVLATLVFPVRGIEVMLAEKVQKIGAGCLNGWGGKVKTGESLRACAAREFFEESCAKINEKDLVKVGIVHFTNHNTDRSVFICVVHVYTITRWTGEIVSTREMKSPAWYRRRFVAREKLMLADRYWLSKMLSGKKGIVWAEYGPHQQTLIGDVCFEPVDSFEEE